MTTLEIRVQNGNVAVCVGGDSPSAAATEAKNGSGDAILMQHQVDGSSANGPAQPVPAGASSLGIIVVGPIVIDIPCEGAVSAEGGNPAADDTNSAGRLDDTNPGGNPATDDTNSGGGPTGSVLVIGPIVVRGGVAPLRENRRVAPVPPPPPLPSE